MKLAALHLPPVRGRDGGDLLALWGGDDAGFVQRLFHFVNSHRRVRMMLYNQGNDPNGPFRLKRFPRSRAAIRHALHSPRFLASVD